MGPTQGGFVQFIRNVMGIDTTVLPDGAAVIGYAYAAAVSVVNKQLRFARGPSGYPSQYAYAVYNLAADNLLNFGIDLPDAPVVPGSGSTNNPAGLPFFAYTRQRFNINGFIGGVINSTSDQGTSQSMVVPEQMTGLTFADLQNLKTPYGRRYLGIAQAVGSLHGIT